MKKIFLWLLTISFSVGALFALFVFIFGNFGDIEFKILASVIAMGIYSLTGFCSTLIYQNKRILSLLGIIVAIDGFLFTLSGIWFFELLFDLESFFKIVFAFGVISFLFSHISLLLVAPIKERSVLVVRGITIAFSSVLAGMLIYFIFFNFDVEVIFFRALGSIAVLSVLGTFLTFFLRKMLSRNIQ